ncbi:hypothetical protein ACFL20_06115 [Spirochaetota bacterium]
MLKINPELYSVKLIKIFKKPTKEMLLWNSFLKWLFPTNPAEEWFFIRFIKRVLVTPTAHFANLSVDFQAFLYGVFHQSFISRISHIILMPLITFFMIASLLTLSYIAALVYLAAFIILYVMQSYILKGPLWGIMNCCIMAALFLLVPFYNEWYAAIVSDMRYNVFTWLFSPWFLMFFFAFLQAVSHAAEPMMPPRANLTNRWLSVKDFMAGGSSSPGIFSKVKRAFLLAVQLIYGMLDEWWAGPRLLPFVIMNIMWSFGYKDEYKREILEYVNAAIDEGNPAMDYIGTGGGVPLGAALKYSGD